MFSPNNFNIDGKIDSYGEQEKINITWKTTERYGITAEPIIQIELLRQLSRGYALCSIPLLSMIATCGGMNTWIVIICFAYFIYSKNYKNALVIVPILIMLLTLFAGPIADLRYLYSMILITPFYMSLLFTTDDNYNKSSKVDNEYKKSKVESKRSRTTTTRTANEYVGKTYS